MHSPHFIFKFFLLCLSPELKIKITSVVVVFFPFDDDEDDINIK